MGSRIMGAHWALLGVLLLFPVWVGAEQSATVLWYLEQEAGIEPYRVRYIITEDFMRSDEGDDEGAFALFDRKERQIYSVVPANRTILQVDGRGVSLTPPEQLSIEVKQAVDEKAPKVGGQSPVSVELLADKTLCYSAVVVPDFLEQARAAFQEFAQSLAVQQLLTLGNTPEEYQTPCFLSRYLYAGDFHLQRGVPLLEWDGQGDRRELIAYEEAVELDESLFELPDEFAVIQASGR